MKIIQDENELKKLVSFMEENGMETIRGYGTFDEFKKDILDKNHILYIGYLKDNNNKKNEVPQNETHFIIEELETDKDGYYEPTGIFLHYWGYDTEADKYVENLLKTNSIKSQVADNRCTNCNKSNVRYTKSECLKRAEFWLNKASSFSNISSLDKISEDSEYFKEYSFLKEKSAIELRVLTVEELYDKIKKLFNKDFIAIPVYYGYTDGVEEFLDKLRNIPLYNKESPIECFKESVRSGYSRLGLDPQYALGALKDMQLTLDLLEGNTKDFYDWEKTIKIKIIFDDDYYSEPEFFEFALIDFNRYYKLLEEVDSFNEKPKKEREKIMDDTEEADNLIYYNLCLSNLSVDRSNYRIEHIW